MKKWNLYQFILGIIIAIVVIPSLFWEYKDSKIIISSENFKVQNDIYNINIPIDEITGTDTLLWNDMPTITLRTNGFSLMGVNRGHFRTKDGNSVWLSVKSGISPVIRITDKSSRIYYLNRKNPDETRKIFISLSDYIKNRK